MIWYLITLGIFLVIDIWMGLVTSLRVTRVEQRMTRLEDDSRKRKP